MRVDVPDDHLPIEKGLVSHIFISVARLVVSDRGVFLLVAKR